MYSYINTIFIRFCSEKDIHKTCRLNETELDEVVAAAVDQVYIVMLLWLAIVANYVPLRIFC